MAQLGTLVRRVAAAVADGHPIEWARVHASARSIDERSIIDQLRCVADIESPSAEPESLRAAGQPLWWQAVVVLGILQVVIGLSSAAGSTATDSIGRLLSFQIAICGAFGAAAVLLLYAGRADRRATSLAHVYVLFAAAFARPLLVAARVPSDSAALSLFVTGVYPEAFLACALSRFASTFPRTYRFDRFDHVMTMLTAVAATVGAVLFIGNVVIARVPLESAPALHVWLRAIQRTSKANLFWTTTYPLMAAALVAPVWRAKLASADERRRVWAFVAALVAGMLPIFVEGLLEFTVPSFRVAMKRGGAFRHAVDLTVLFSLLTVPFSTSYVVAVHRVITVRIALHHSARRILARSTLAVATLVLLIIPVTLAYKHQDLTVGELLRHPGSVGAEWGLFAILILVPFRERILDALDRWLIGQPIDYSVRLAAAADAIGRARTTLEVCDETAQQTRDAFDVPSVTVLLSEDGTNFRSRTGSAPVVFIDSAVGALLADTPAVSLDRDGRLFALLPLADQQWVVKTEAGAIVRIAGGTGAPMGAIVVQRRRSGAGFSTADLSFMSALAATAAPALTRCRERSPANQDDANDAFECEQCGRVAVERSCTCDAPRRPSPLPAMLANKFSVEQRLGRGGMGVVYRGTDTQLDRRVALKTLPRVTGNAAAAMFAEARTMAAVNHPNLAMIYGIETWRSTPVLIVEYLAGGTLAERLAAGALDVGVALRMGVALAAGLDALHGAGILHCDLKPSNIGFHDNSPKLLDFGVARLLLHADAHHGMADGSADIVGDWSWTALVGTPLYMSPERLNGRIPDVRSDLWSLAMSLLEAMIGAYPFRFTTVDQCVERLRQGTPHMSDRVSALPPDVLNWFSTALHPNVDLRPQRAIGAVETLTALAARY
jgi:hypothetical protein